MRYEISTRKSKVVIASTQCKEKDDHYSALFMALCYVALSRRSCSYLDKATFINQFTVNVFGNLTARFRCESIIVTFKEDTVYASVGTYTYRYEVTVEDLRKDPSQTELQLLVAEARHLCGISKRRFVTEP